MGLKGDPLGLLLRMLRLLRDAGLQVTAANHEFSPGQFEINLGHSDMIDAADRSFRLKSAVQEIARQRDLLATFMAKPFNDEGGSGFHVHASMNDGTGANIFGDPDGPDGISAIGRHAIGGVLRHARAMSALLNPTINSFKRFGPDTLAPWLIDWGLDNRSAMVRIPPERGPAARMQVRLGDAAGSRRRSWRDTATTLPRRTCFPRASPTRSTPSNPILSSATCSADTSSTPSWPTSAMRSSGSSDS